MQIGFTYDLKDDYLHAGFTEEQAAEFDSIETIDGIANVLTDAGHSVDRIGNAKSLIERLASGDRWDLVFNIAEGMYGSAREALVPALLEAYNIPVTFSSASVLSLCLDKALCKRVVASFGFKTAPFCEVKSLADLDRVNIEYPLFAKPIAEGTSKGITGMSKVGNRKELEKTCAELLQKYKQSVLVEKFLPGREFTVGIVGSGEKARVIGNIEIIYGEKAEKGIYSYDNKANYQDRITYAYAVDSAAKSTEDAALAIYKSLDVRDAGRVDMRLDDDGEPCFIEVNPLAGLNPSISDLPIIAYKRGMTYPQLIREIIASSCERL